MKQPRTRRAPPVSFRRCLDADFESFLMPRQPLRFLIENVRIHGIDGPKLEPQLRRRNRLMLYAGLTRVIDLAYNSRAREFAVRAADAYDLTGHGVARRYSAADVNLLAEDLQRYLAGVRVDPRYFEREGKCQSWLSRRFGIDRAAPGEWATVDSESVIGFADTPTKQRFWAPILEKARRTLTVVGADPRRFGVRVGSRGLGGELDLLLWDPRAREFLVTEVKDGTSAAGVYFSPLQVGCYLAAWQAFAAADPRGALLGLRELLAQKLRLGMISNECPLPESEEDLRFRPVIVVHLPNIGSSCWKKMAFVRQTLKADWNNGLEAQDLLKGLMLYAVADGKLADISVECTQW